MMEFFWGTVAFISSLVGLIPQVVKAYKTKSTTDVSLLMLVNYLIGSIAWVIYGLLSRSVFVVWSNVFGGSVSAISIFQKWFYERGKR